LHGRWLRAEREAERIFEMSPALLAVAGFDGYLRRFNPAFEVFGYPERAVDGAQRRPAPKQEPAAARAGDFVGAAVAPSEGRGLIQRPRPAADLVLARFLRPRHADRAVNRQGPFGRSAAASTRTPGRVCAQIQVRTDTSRALSRRTDRNTQRVAAAVARMRERDGSRSRAGGLSEPSLASVRTPTADTTASGRNR
jgi:hypothetical protein